MSLGPVYELLRERRGIDPASLSQVGAESGVRRRMRALAIDRVGAYADRLAVDPAEFERFVSFVLVHETSFFRYPASFDLLAGEAQTRLEAGKGAVFRLHCVASSTGEEPASAVMALLEAGVEATRFHVDATDISARAIDYARRARYRRRGVRGLPANVRERWFDLRGESYELRAPVRERIRHRVADALAPGFGQGAARYDAVFCRNLLIYLVPEARAAVLKVVLGMLRPGGLLFVGHAEVAAARALGLKLALPTEAFACRHVTAVVRAPAPRLPVAPAPATAPPPRERPQPPAAPASAAPQPDAEKGLRRASRLADAGNLEEARRALLEDIAAGPALADHYHLLALVESARGQDDASEDALRRALYLDPHHHPSLMQLALLAETRGDRGRARRLRAKAARVKGAGDDV